MEKRKPHYPLADVKAAFSGTLNRTVTALNGADDLGMNDGDVVAVIQGLARTDFDKSMTSNVDSKVWQDVYKPAVDGRELYVKFTLDAQQNYLLISFKEA